MAAHEDDRRHHDEALSALRRDLEAARYAADRARRQFDAVDPANRLVADELERRWNQALEEVRPLEGRIDRLVQPEAASIGRSLDAFTELANDLEKTWQAPGSDARLKKRIVRTLIEEVVADVDTSSCEVLLSIHWRGGIPTELRRPRRRRGEATKTSKDVVAAVRSLARPCTDDVIASVLHRNGLRTGRGNRWSRERVVSRRNGHEVPCHSSECCREQGWLKRNPAAAVLGVRPRTRRLAIERGEIAGEHPLDDGPWIINRQALQSPAAEELARRARSRTRNPAKSSPTQQTLGFSST